MPSSFTLPFPLQYPDASCRISIVSEGDAFILHRIVRTATSDMGWTLIGRRPGFSWPWPKTPTWCTVVVSVFSGRINANGRFALLGMRQSEERKPRALLRLVEPESSGLICKVDSVSWTPVSVSDRHSQCVLAPNHLLHHHHRPTQGHGNTQLTLHSD
ncbi:uncharacterized protein LY79DRAFT_343920 [Colletotrichum navitas]|uniref:Uncharacterized protein n=1 Tax=Colletotrichum navitas TaxID=681940 RepID=A0AAD8V295_9PEZI|nr:uncharacterized protein LY79DRAFT_343920 [Colletotrichum navitas]KAK1579489.1 hypothetical protein LY79DRAFT_343920 [Colletotrichum navitas]